MLAQHYDSSRHIIEDLYHDELEDIDLAANQMVWLLKRVRCFSSVVPHQTEIKKG